MPRPGRAHRGLSCLRADAFSVFNRLNLNNPNVTVTAAQFGRIATAKIPQARRS